ncbi:Dynamitin [Carpediemonas membranifera]|uniref:Dynamitin n=1 Tax=Carpediemonas membranifera TaxID=201153 RepID=A0A8J6ARF0_9EUKA|nr:Dynamitin [Carpediemonas membranifera]|eukprot:KAG9389520.1 Dynamitin [Carpediemonas membranifera]
MNKGQTLTIKPRAAPVAPNDMNALNIDSRIDRRATATVRAFEMLQQAQFGERLGRMKEKSENSLDSLQERYARLLRDADALERDIKASTHGATAGKALESMRAGILQSREKPLIALREALGSSSVPAAGTTPTLDPVPAASEMATTLRKAESRVAAIEKEMGGASVDVPLRQAVDDLKADVRILSTTEAGLTSLSRALAGITAQARKLRDVIGPDGDMTHIVDRLVEWDRALPSLGWVLDRMETLEQVHQSAVTVGAAVGELEEGQRRMVEMLEQNRRMIESME